MNDVIYLYHKTHINVEIPLYSIRMNVFLHYVDKNFDNKNKFLQC